MSDISDKKLYTLVAAITIFIACMPLFTLNCIGGHDIAYHLLRVEALKTGIMAGRPFLRINMLFFGGMGYASSLFYPDLLLYFPALLRVCGVGINLSWHLFVALCIILGFASCFYSAKHIAKSSYAAMLTAVIFTLYQYHIYDIYTRSAAGEFTAVIFVPFVIAGLYDVICEEFKKPWLLIIGMAGVLLCHTITAVICALLCLAAVAADIRGMIHKPVKLLRLILAAVLILGLTAFYWLPVVEMLSTGVFSSEFTFDTAYEAAKLWEVPFNEYNRMGAAVFALLLSGLLVRERQRFADLCALAGAVITVLATGIFPWERFGTILGFVQFPWRLFVITGPLLAFAEGLYLSRLADELDGTGGRRSPDSASRIMLVLVLAIMCVSAVGNFQHNTEKYYSYSSDYFDYAPFTAEVIGGEWLPVAASDREEIISRADSAFADNDSEIAVSRQKNELVIDKIPAGTGYVDVPFIYYKGYAAVNAENNKFLAVTGEGRNGLVRVYTDGAEAVRVFYRGTLLQHIADALSVGTVIGVLAYALIPVIKKKKNSGGENDEG